MAEYIFYKSPAHKARLLMTMQKLGKIDGELFDPEYAAALYILTADTGTWKKAQEYVSRDGIDIETMLKEVDFSGGYGVLIQLAGNLFNGNEHLDPLEFLRLDENNFQVALSALKIRRYSLRMNDFK